MDRFYSDVDRAGPSLAERMDDRRQWYLGRRDRMFATASWPRCTLILIADEGYRFPSLPPFHPYANRVGWDGPRVSDQPACGGGRRVIRKHEPFN
jgi:hypothetical protein